MKARPTVSMPSNPRLTRMSILPASAAFEVCELDPLVDDPVPDDVEEVPGVVDPEAAELDCESPEDELDEGDEADERDTDGRDAVGMVVNERDRDTDGIVIDPEVEMLKLAAWDAAR